jgi:hypothetical protein
MPKQGIICHTIEEKLMTQTECTNCQNNLSQDNIDNKHASCDACYEQTHNAFVNTHPDVRFFITLYKSKSNNGICEYRFGKVPWLTIPTQEEMTECSTEQHGHCNWASIFVKEVSRKEYDLVNDDTDIDLKLLASFKTKDTIRYDLVPRTIYPHEMFLNFIKGVS